MSDTVKSWIDERRRIQGAARPFTNEDPDDFESLDPWGPSEDLERIGRNHKAGEDACDNFPRALDAIEEVLELHAPERSYFGDGEYGDSEWCGACRDEGGDLARYPCPTVQAIISSIKSVS